MFNVSQTRIFGAQDQAMKLSELNHLEKRLDKRVTLPDKESEIIRKFYKSQYFNSRRLSFSAIHCRAGYDAVLVAYFRSNSHWILVNEN